MRSVVTHLLYVLLLAAVLASPGCGSDGSSAAIADARVNRDSSFATDGAAHADAEPGSIVDAIEATDAHLAALTIAPLVYDYGQLVVIRPSASFTVTNDGGGASTPLSVTLGGANGGSFSITSDGCSGNTLAMAATCTVEVTPSESRPLGTLSATLSVTAATGGTATSMLRVTLLPDEVPTIVPTPYDFGDITTSTASPPQTFTVGNVGFCTGVFTTSLSGDDSADFIIDTDNCDGQSLAGGDFCTILVRFAPTVSGPKSAVLSANRSCGGTASASIKGAGI